METTGPEKCFVVMPFGSKPINDGSGRRYDFDKVYRVIMKRAIRLAGLDPIRADERKGSNIIHTDMFKDLRDQAVVLADLSLENPNVFYELGIRHVMSSRGTVLMCRDGSELPFDVKLSRVIFYRYDGSSLDWEEAERVVQELQVALEEAKRRTPDSPVYALLERVVRDVEPGALSVGAYPHPLPDPGHVLDEFQRIVADYWAGQNQGLGELHCHYRTSRFGARALGYYCLAREFKPLETVVEVARTLYYAEQYDLANRVYERLVAADALETEDLLRYASSLSEEEPSLAGVRRALLFMQRARDRPAKKLEQTPDDPGAVLELCRCDYALAGLLTWRWHLTKADDDLLAAIDAHQAAIATGNRALTEHGDGVGRLAHAHLKLLLLLRTRDGNRDRPDTERHREAILALKPTAKQDARSLSYLRWYQAITLADAGDSEGSRRMALVAFSEDAKLVNEKAYSDLGRRQYMLLRRFIEHNAHGWRNPSLVGHVSQILQIGHEPTR